MKVFITGASGFIGSRIALSLLDKGYTVHALMRTTGALPISPSKYLVVFRGDLHDNEAIEKAMRGCEEVYHCAGYARLWAADRNEFYRVNVEGTNNILEQAVRANVRKLVFTSSTAVMGPSMKRPIIETDPRVTSFDTDYELSKLMAEQQVQAYVKKGLNCVIVSPSRVYGPGPLSYSNALSRFLLRLLKGNMVIVPSVADIIANYVFVDDVAEGHLKAMAYGITGERYILGGENASYRQLVKLVKARFIHPRLLSVPLPMLRICSYFELFKCNLIGGYPAITPAMLDRYYQNAAFCSEKAKTQLGYKITGLGEGIDKTIFYLKTNSQ